MRQRIKEPDGKWRPVGSVIKVQICFLLLAVHSTSIDVRGKAGLDHGYTRLPQGYILSKYVEDSPFDRYVGYPRGADTDTNRVMRDQLR